MIESIEFNNLKNNWKYNFLSNLNFFKKDRKIEFTDGINIIFSPNGSGKTTLLNILAMNLAAKQGGISKITKDWNFEMSIRPDIMKGIEVAHDGQTLLYLNSRDQVGIDKYSKIDEDFSKEGFVETFDNSSSGFLTIQRTSRLLKYIEDLKSLNSNIEDKSKIKNEYLKDLIKPKISKGKPTFILDEPESGLSPIFQGNFFDNLKNLKHFNYFQWIISTHSPFSLLIPNANIICLMDDFDYLSATLNAYKKLFNEIENKY